MDFGPDHAVYGSALLIFALTPLVSSFYQPRRRMSKPPIVRYLDHANGKIERAIRAKRKLIALLNEQKQAIIHRAVTRGLDPNVKLKPSGIPWLGDVPEHWAVRRVKQITRILRGKFTHRPRNDPSLYDGPYPFIQTGAVAQAGKFITGYKQTLNERGFAVSKLFPSGTLVMTIAANIGDVAILNFDACFPDSIVGFVPSAFASRDYLYLVFKCLKSELLREAPVNTQGNLNVERIGSMGIPIPPIDEQQQIVASIETETHAFSATIARAEREIDLLREYRTRLTADVVTGKLDVRDTVKHLPTETEEPPPAENLPDDSEDEAPEEPQPMTTDTSEKGLESVIVRDLLAAGWQAGASKDYDREYCVDLRTPAGVRAGHAAEACGGVRSGQRQPQAAAVPGPAGQARSASAA